MRGPGIPLTILEADIFFALASAPDDELWLGGCADDITLTDEFEQRKLEFPGVPQTGRKRVGETHVIEIGNLWLIDTSQDPPVMAEVQGGETYKMIITWIDEDTGYWAKRTYEGVTLRTDRIRTPNQNLAFDATTVDTGAGVPA